MQFLKVSLDELCLKLCVWSVEDGVKKNKIVIDERDCGVIPWWFHVWFCWEKKEKTVMIVVT